MLEGRINHSISTFGKLDPINAKNTFNDVYFHELKNILGSRENRYTIKLGFIQIIAPLQLVSPCALISAVRGSPGQSRYNIKQFELEQFPHLNKIIVETLVGL